MYKNHSRQTHLHRPSLSCGLAATCAASPDPAAPRAAWGRAATGGELLRRQHHSYPTHPPTPQASGGISEPPYMRSCLCFPGAQVTKPPIPSYLLIFIKCSSVGGMAPRRGGAAVRLYDSHPDCNATAGRRGRTPSPGLWDCHRLVTAAGQSGEESFTPQRERPHKGTHTHMAQCLKPEARGGPGGQSRPVSFP